MRFSKSQLNEAKLLFVLAFFAISICIILFKRIGKVKGIQFAIPLSWNEILYLLPYILLIGFISGLIAYFSVLWEFSKILKRKK
jgi:hypothetical protein